MAWNKPAEERGNREAEERSSRLKQSAFRFSICVAFVVIGIAAVWWWQRDVDTKAPSAESKTHETIREVKPAPAMSNAVEKVINPNEETYRDERGILRRKVGNGRVYDPTVKTIKINPNVDKEGNPRYHSKFMIFKDPVDTEIARIISTPQGATVFGSRNYGKKFEELFNKSLQKPIEQDPSDTPYERKLKENVASVKADIAERVRKGEKLTNIFGQADKEIRRLYAYRKSLKDQLKHIATDKKLSAADMGDAVKAANIMLKERGCSPVSESAFVNAHLKMQAAEQVSSEVKQ